MQAADAGGGDGWQWRLWQWRLWQWHLQAADDGGSDGRSAVAVAAMAVAYAGTRLSYM